MQKLQPQQIIELPNDRRVQVMTLAKHADTDEEMVVFQELSGDFGVYCCALSRFLSKTGEGAGGYSDSAKDRSGHVTDSHREEAEKLNLDPRVVAFLDADSVAARLRILDTLRADITDDMIDVMSMAVDMHIDPADDPYERFVEFRETLVTKQRYEESGRLRG